MRLRYVEALEPASVQRELGISRAQFYRDHARAMDALTLLLVQQGHWQVLSPPAAAPDRDDTLRKLPAGPGEGAALHGEGAAPPGVSEAGSRRLGMWQAIVLMSAGWGLAWFVVWTFAQTSGWPFAWAMGGAVSGLSTGVILRLAAPAISLKQAQVVTLGWTGAWTGAWLLGWSIARFIEWAVRLEVLAGSDPNSTAYAIARVIGWAGGGPITGNVVRAATRYGLANSRWVAAAVALGWIGAGAVGHGLFWTLDPSLYVPGARFALSGLVEGAIGGGVTLWQIGRRRRRGAANRS